MSVIDSEKILMDGDNSKLRLAAVEVRISSVETLLNNLIGSSSIRAVKVTKKLSSLEKEKIKAKLLEEVPYVKSQLQSIKTKELKLLASALGVNSFGMKTDDIIKAILTAQKKKRAK